MPAYKLYCVDGERRIVVAKSVVAENAAQALSFAKQIANQGVSAELWARDRLIGHFIIRSGPQS